MPLWQRNLTAAAIGQVLNILSFQASFVLIPYYIQQMGITDQTAVSAWTAAYQTAGAVAFAIFTPIWGVVGDRYGRKPMLVRATVATAAMLVLMGLARTPTQLVILRVIQGCVTGTPAAASALVATGSPKNRLAYGLGLLQTGLFIGSSLGPMLGGYIADTFSYRSTFFVSASIVALSVLITIWLVKEPEESAATRARARSEGPIAGFKALMGSRQIMLLIGMTFAVNMTISLTGPVFPLLIQELVADSSRLASTAGTIQGAAAFTAAISALVVGRLSDSIGYRRTLIGCSLGTAILYFPQALVRSTLALGGLFGAQGLFRGGIAPNISAMVVRAAPRDKIGVSMGLNSSAGSAGFAVGPMLGALFLSLSSTRTVFTITGIICVLVTLTIVLFTGQVEQPQDEDETTPAATAP